MLKEPQKELNCQGLVADEFNTTAYSFKFAHNTKYEYIDFDVQLFLKLFTDIKYQILQNLSVTCAHSD
uniref:Uncharacterized protein n=1 Tax=Glossina morsitans morsitans TaxID=37546 RepID=A0A1B0G7W3_GLOMM